MDGIIAMLNAHMDGMKKLVAIDFVIEHTRPMKCVFILMTIKQYPVENIPIVQMVLLAICFTNQVKDAEDIGTNENRMYPNSNLDQNRNWHSEERESTNFHRNNTHWSTTEVQSEHFNREEKNEVRMGLNSSFKNEMGSIKNDDDRWDNSSVRSFLKTYKTQQCHQCEQKIYPLCREYHNAEDRRRMIADDWQVTSYHYAMCSNVFDYENKKFRRNENEEIVQCEDGDACPMAHNFYEIWFHPFVFRTVYCPFMEKLGECWWRDVCSHYHSETDQRKSPHKEK